MDRLRVHFVIPPPLAVKSTGRGAVKPPGFNGLTERLLTNIKENPAPFISTG